MQSNQDIIIQILSRKKATKCWRKKNMIKIKQRREKVQTNSIKGIKRREIEIEIESEKSLYLIKSSCPMHGKSMYDVEHIDFA